MKMMKTHSIMKIINNSLIDFPTPINISNFWNLGSMLGLCLIIQILTGIFLSMHYCPNTLLAFDSMSHIYRNVNLGWLIRMIHINSASMFFICLYTHMARGIYFSSFNFKETWTIGMIILILIMMTAFTGYILPWGQMSFWGATVITNLLSTLPYIGTIIVEWIWGGFTINNSTLNRFYTFHFLLPFIITAFVIIHLMFLHITGSNNPLGINSNLNKIPFHPYFSIKDLTWFSMMIMILLLMSLLKPFMFTDPENFIQANPLSTPTHIKPEWYFLFAYSILRSIPNKLGGTIMLIMSISVFFLMPTMKKLMQSNNFYPLNKLLFWMFLSTCLLLTWMGTKPVEEPFIILSQALTIIYFSYFPLNLLMYKTWDLTMK